MNRGPTSRLVIAAAVIGVVLLAAAAGAAGGYAAAVSHPVPGPAGATGPVGPIGPRGPAGPAVAAAQTGICVSVETVTNYQAIPPTTLVTSVQISSPRAGSCAGRGTYVTVG